MPETDHRAPFLELAVMRARGLMKPRLSALGERISPLQLYRSCRADVFIISFPKTGRTWLRMMLHTALARYTGVEPAEPLEFYEFTDADPAVPRIRMFHEDEPHWKLPHQMRKNKGRCRHKRVILLVRDPRDTIVSLYYQMTKRWKVTDATLHDFVWQKRGSFESMIAYYNAWAKNVDTPADFLLIRYEDMHSEPEATLRKALDFMGLRDVTEAAIEEAAQANTFRKMRRREERLEVRSSRFRPGDMADPSSFKTRQGKVGGYREVLSEEDVASMTRIIEERMDPMYGYPLP